MGDLNIARGGPRIDPMQDPMRPAVFMNYAQNEPEAERVLRKLACWLGLPGYDAAVVDVGLVHRQIVEGVLALLTNAGTTAPSHVAEVRTLTEPEILTCAAAAGCEGAVTLTYTSGPHKVMRISTNLAQLAESIQRAFLAANGLPHRVHL